MGEICLSEWRVQPAGRARARGEARGVKEEVARAVDGSRGDRGKKEDGVNARATR